MEYFWKAKTWFWGNVFTLFVCSHHLTCFNTSILLQINRGFLVDVWPHCIISLYITCQYEELAWWYLPLSWYSAILRNEKTESSLKLLITLIMRSSPHRKRSAKPDAVIESLLQWRQRRGGLCFTTTFMLFFKKKTLVEFKEVIVKLYLKDSLNAL